MRTESEILVAFERINAYWHDHRNCCLQGEPSNYVASMLAGLVWCLGEDNNPVSSLIADLKEREKKQMERN